MLKVQQNPLDRATIYKKSYNPVTKKYQKMPFEAGVAVSKDDITTTYHFLEDKTNRELGYIKISDFRHIKDAGLKKMLSEVSPVMEDFPEFGIVGDRIFTSVVQNNFKDEISGIGEAADQIKIEYCLKEKIKPVIISEAVNNSHAAHYKRGLRFFRITRNTNPNNPRHFILDKNMTDPNEIIKKRIEKTTQGQRVFTNDLKGLYTYFPKELMQKYMKRIMKNRILH